MTYMLPLPSGNISGNMRTNRYCSNIEKNQMHWCTWFKQYCNISKRQYTINIRYFYIHIYGIYIYKGLEFSTNDKNKWTTILNINTYPSTHDVIPKLCRPGSRKSRNDGEHLRTASCGDNFPKFGVAFGDFWHQVLFGEAFAIVCTSFLTRWFQTVCCKVKVEISGGQWQGGAPKDTSIVLRSP